MSVAATVLDDLRGVVGARWVRDRGAELATYAQDGLPTHVSAPGAVATPGTRDELAAVLRVLHRHGTPFEYVEFLRSLVDQEPGDIEVRTKRAELVANLDYVHQVLREGAAKARAKAQEVLKRARKASGLE